MRDVRVNGRVAIPAGSRMSGSVVVVERGGKVRERLVVLGLGGTVATPPGGIESDVIIVSSFDDLARHAGRVLSREVLMDLVRNEKFDPFDRSIDVHVSRIRAAIEDDAKVTLAAEDVPYFAALDDYRAGDPSVIIEQLALASSHAPPPPRANDEEATPEGAAAA